MQIFTKTVIVTKDDLDELNHVNNVRYVKWINDIAKAHWYKNATREMIDNYIWVVLKHHIEYKSPAFLNDIIEIKTYVNISKGATSTRVVEMFNNDKLLLKSKTDFCLLSSKSKKPSRITSEIINLFN